MKGNFFLGTLVWGDMEKKEQATCICNTGTVRRQKRQIGILLQQQKQTYAWWLGVVYKRVECSFLSFREGCVCIYTSCVEESVNGRCIMVFR